MAHNLFVQNIIAVVWDFDKTLSPRYMQAPLFKRFGVDERRFFTEANELAELYKRDGVKNVSKDLLYLNHILTYVSAGKFPGLNNALLRELGAEIELFDGLPLFFKSLREAVDADPRLVGHGTKVEHYIVSTGLREMIMGSKIASYVDGVWGCEFSESVGLPGYLDNGYPPSVDPEARTIRGIGYAIDNTTKTRALFEINKGSSWNKSIDVNASLAIDDRRVPFKNMIYIGDGPSDIPAFSIVNQYHGKTFAVYEPGSVKHFEQVARLQTDKRVQGFGPASYLAGSHSAMWLTNAIAEIAVRIANERENLLRERVGEVPDHILTDQRTQVDSKLGEVPAKVIQEETHVVVLDGSAQEVLLSPSAVAHRSVGSPRPTRFFKVCQLFLKKDFSQHESVLLNWHEERLSRVPEAQYEALVAEFERSARGPNDPLQRRAAGVDNGALTKLVSFLNDLAHKHGLS